MQNNRNKPGHIMYKKTTHPQQKTNKKTIQIFLALIFFARNKQHKTNIMQKQYAFLFVCCSLTNRRKNKFKKSYIFLFSHIYTHWQITLQWLYKNLLTRKSANRCHLQISNNNHTNLLPVSHFARFLIFTSRNFCRETLFIEKTWHNH